MAFSLRKASKQHKKAKRKKDSRRAKNGARPKQKGAWTQKDTAKVHAGLLPQRMPRNAELAHRESLGLTILIEPNACLCPFLPFGVQCRENMLNQSGALGTK